MYQLNSFKTSNFIVAIKLFIQDFNAVKNLASSGCCKDVLTENMKRLLTNLWLIAFLTLDLTTHVCCTEELWNGYLPNSCSVECIPTVDLIMYLPNNVCMPISGQDRHSTSEYGKLLCIKKLLISERECRSWAWTRCRSWCAWSRTTAVSGKHEIVMVE